MPDQRPPYRPRSSRIDDGMKDPIGLIAQKGQRLRLQCVGCGHEGEIDISALGERVGLGLTLAQLQKRARCEGCQTKNHCRVIILG